MGSRPIQQKLNALSLGVEAWLEHPSHWLGESWSNIWTELNGTPVASFPEEEAEFVKLRRSAAVQQLGYGRLGDGWALLVRTMSFAQVQSHGVRSNTRSGSRCLSNTGQD
jgi:hypothetical protein